MSNQLVKRNPVEGYKNVFPKTFIDAIKDRESGASLEEIIQGFNMYFLSYNGSVALTRCKVPKALRKEGLWITYVLYDHTVVTEWYNSDNIDDESWGSDSNWRKASNALVGDISISTDGYWVINGTTTNIKAQGETGTTPLLRVGDNNKIQVTYDEGKNWEDISDYIVPKFRWNQGTGTTAGTIQISMDLGNTWKDLSNPITNNLRISKYIGINESLPASGVAEGTVYMKGPYYDENDSLNENPIYRMWVYAWKGNTLAWQDNGEFTSISAGVVQERGTSTTQVMSQDAVTRELTELESETDLRVPIKPGKNLFDKDSVIVDCRFLSDGTIQKNDYTFYFAITGYILCEPLTSYNLTKEGNSSVVSTGSYCCFYTKDFELISTKEGSFTNFTTPENCTYMRLTVLKDALNSKIQLQKGTTYRTEYEEYQPIEGYLEAVKNLESEVNELGIEVASSTSLLSERVAEVDVNLSTIEDTIGISHKLVKTIEAAGGYARVEVFVISLEEGKKYVFEATDLQSNTNTNYAYIYDSDEKELTVKGGVGEKIILEYTPTQKFENAVIKVASNNTTTLKCILTEDIGCNNITKLEERVGNLFNGNDVVELSIIDKFFVTAATGYEGTLSDNETSCATSFIPMHPKSKVRIDNLYLVSNRSVCAYNKSRECIGVIAANSYDTSVIFEVPEDCYYVRASGKVGISPTVTYLSIPYGIKDICITSVEDITITNGKYITRFAGFEGVIDNASDSAASDYIKVIPSSIITIDGAYSEGNRSCCAYDKDKKFVSVIVSNQTATRSTANIQLPQNAYYIRITSAKDVIPSVKYVNTIIDGENVVPQYITNERLFDEAAAVPVLSFVDDDTWDVKYVERLKNLCDTLGIKLSFACLTEQVEKNEGLLETLLSFEREGFPVIFHGNQQIEAYHGATAEDLIKQERDFVKGLQMMHNFGFTDYKIWVTPFGQARPDQRALAMKWGMEAIITSAGIRVTNDPTRKEDFVRYRILRNGLGNNVPMTADELAENVANIKIAIDKAVACNGWCLVSMHSAFDMFFNGELDSTISEIVQYARDKGVEIRTVNEELRRRRPIFNYYEQY